MIYISCDFRGLFLAAPPASPIKPIPRRTTAVGSGVGKGVSSGINGGTVVTLKWSFPHYIVQCNVTGPSEYNVKSEKLKAPSNT